MPSTTKQLHVILDVDGVTRLDVNSTADPRVINQVNKLLDLENSTPKLKDKIRFTFLSGSHSSDVKIPASPNGLPISWRTPNLPLSKVFDKCFPKSAFDSGRLSIYGQLGCDTAVVSPTTPAENETENLNQTSLTGRVIYGLDEDVRIKLLEIVLKSYGEFLRDTNNFTKEEFDEFCALLTDAVSKCLVTKECEIPKDHTPDVFEHVAAFAREKTQDPLVRIISHKGNSEIGCSPRRNKDVDYRVDGLKLLDYMKEKVSKNADPRISSLIDRVSGGVAHLNGEEFCWAVVTASSKGIACLDLLKMYQLGEKEDEERKETTEPKSSPSRPPNVSLITVGDSHVDFSMHELTAARSNTSSSSSSPQPAVLYDGMGFHVGPPSTLEKMSKQDPTKFSHVTLVPLDQCEESSKITTGMTEEMIKKMEHLHGKTDVMALTTGTLEVLMRLEMLLKLHVADDNAEVDFSDVVKNLTASFKK